MRLTKRKDRLHGKEHAKLFVDHLFGNRAHSRQLRIHILREKNVKPGASGQDDHLKAKMEAPGRSSEEAFVDVLQPREGGKRACRRAFSGANIGFRHLLGDCAELGCNLSFLKRKEYLYPSPLSGSDCELLRTALFPPRR